MTFVTSIENTFLISRTFLRPNFENIKISIEIMSKI